MNPTPVSVQGNSQPTGGFTTPQPVQPNASPTTLDELIANLTPAIAKFRAASSPLSVALDTVAIANSAGSLANFAGAEPAIRVPNVGLGYRIVREHNLTITLDNTAASAVTINFGSRFPYDLISKSTLDINGGGTPFSASGWGSLLALGRQRPGFWKSSGDNAPGLSRALVRISASGGTLNANTSGQWSASGYQSVTVAASTTCTLTVTFYTIEKLAKDRTGLIGALPLQNNSTYATLTTKILGAITGTNAQFPLWVATTFPSTVTVGVPSYTISGRYKFWSVPSNQALFAEMVSNSYQIQEASGVQIPATGNDAFKYDLPQNCYFGAAHMQFVDGNGAFIAFDDISPLKVEYNAGSVIPVNEPQGTQRAEQYADYDGDLANLPGYVLWDGDNTSESLLDTDDTGWINTYAVAKPQLVADVAGGVVTPALATITREVLVVGSVVVVGG